MIKPIDYIRAPISGLFVFRPFAKSSIVLPYSKIELLKNRRTVKILSGSIVAHNIYRQTAQPLGGLKHRAIYNIQQA